MTFLKPSIAILIFTSIFFAGCNTKPLPAKDLIVNKWKLSKMSGGMAPGMNDSLRRQVLKHLAMEFTADGQYILTGSDLTTHKGTYSISDDELTLTITPVGTGKPEKNMLNEVTKTELILTDEGGTRLTCVPK